MMFNCFNPFQLCMSRLLPYCYNPSFSIPEQVTALWTFVQKGGASIKELYEIVERYGGDISAIKMDIEELKKELEKVAKGEYINLYLDSIMKYIDENLEEIVSRIAKFVYFGLNNDGHFVAYIPESWDMIKFNTIMNYNDKNYGSLTLTY